MAGLLIGHTTSLKSNLCQCFLHGFLQVTHQGQRIERCREFLGQTLDDAASLAAYDGYLAADQRNWQAFPDALPGT